MVCDEDGQPTDVWLSDGNASDYRGARHFLQRLPRARRLLADKGYDAGWFRRGLRKKGIRPCIPGRKHRKKPIPYNKALYRKRHKIENSFSKIKDWRRIAMRYDRCAHTFHSAICIAVVVIWYLN